MKRGHGNWHELMSPDPKAGLTFYSNLFGWKASTAMDMADGHLSTVLARQRGHRRDDGAGNSPVPCWLPYFGSDGVDAAIERIKASGGAIVHGPMEVPAERGSRSRTTHRAHTSPLSGRNERFSPSIGSQSSLAFWTKPLMGDQTKG